MENLVKGTKVLVVDAAHPDGAELAEAAQVLRSGGLVAFPTETVYGLGANALDGQAVARIYAAKGRPQDNPLIVHVAEREAVSQVAAVVPPKAQRLMERFWPGPLTLVLPKTPAVPEEVTCGLQSVGIRMPSHPVARALIRAAGVPVAAPSANLSGRPSPTSAEHVIEDIAGRVDVIVDGGETGVGVESTVLDMTVDPPVLLRPGGVTVEQITAEIGPINLDKAMAGAAPGEKPRSPGMKYKHYAPKAPLILVDGPVLAMQAKIRDLSYEYREEGRRVGIMCCAESRGAYQADVILEYGSRAQPETLACDLFATLRAFDRHQVDVILAEGVSTAGIGLAVMNRLTRAAAGRVVHV